MAYLLDANVFIQAKNLHYGLDFCPAFWEWLDRENKRGIVFSIEKVGDEIEAGADELAQWATARGARFFLPADAALLTTLGRVSAWMTQQHYEPAAVNTFLQVADYYLVAHALAHGHTVVTHEIPADSVRKVKIPNVCIGLGVRCVTPFEMLRIERARFVLEQSAAGTQMLLAGASP
jgi:predicted nucleic acid-binding protein